MTRISIRWALIFVVGMLTLGRAHLASADAQVVSDCGDSGLQTQLRSKLRVAQERDNITITFTCATPVVLTAGVLPTISLNVTIDGGNKITLSGNNASRLFEVGSGGTLTLKDITLTKGYVDGDGGAIYSYGTLNINNSHFLANQTTLNGNGGVISSFGTLNISNSEFAYNKAANGGALYPTGAAAVTTITGSNFHHNQTTSPTYGWGGAIYLSAGTSVTIHSSTLSMNQAQNGGAIYVYQPSSLTLLTVTDNSRLNGNSATSSGGGIYIANGTATLTTVTLSGNSPGEFGAGGGIFNSGGTATLTNVTLSGNQGTAIFNSGGTATLTNVTLSGNSGFALGGIHNIDGTATLKNTLIAKGSSGDNCYGFSGGSFNLSDDTSCNFGAGRDNVNLFLGPLANNGGLTLTHMPQPNSPARDGGTGAGCPATDQRGGARPQGLTCDVGAVEYGAMLPWLYLPLVRR